MSTGNFLFYSLMLLGPVVAISSSSWLVCWVGIELSFLGLIPLLVSEGKTLPSLSSESTLKYFCIQAVGSGVLMWGGIMKFIMPGMTEFWASFIFLVGLCFKLGIFPLHFWVPSVVSGLNWYSIYLILTWQKIAPFLLLMNLIQGCNSLSNIVLSLGGVSAVVGASIGLNQTHISPMLGASSITHSGWVLVASVMGSFWVYFSIYCMSLMLLLIFLEKKSEFLSGMMIISLSGLPPFFMFVGKWSVLKCALSLSEYWWFLVLPLFGSIMSLFFYLKFFYSFYMETSMDFSLKLAWVCCLGVVSFLGALFVVGF